MLTREEKIDKQPKKPSVDVELNVLSDKLEKMSLQIDAMAMQLTDVLQPEFPTVDLSSGGLNITGNVITNASTLSTESLLVSKAKSLSKQAQEIHDRLHRLTERLQV
jgi:hypothetical protein